MRREIISSDGWLDLVKFSLSPKERLGRLGNLIPDLIFPRFWDGKNYVYECLSERLAVFMDDLKAGGLGYFYGYQVSQKVTIC